MEEYKKDGFAGTSGSEMLTLIVVVGVSALVLVFVATLGGSTFNIVEEDIDAITDANVKADVLSASRSGFEAMATVGDYLPLIVLAVVIGIVLAIIMGLGTGRASQAAL